MQSDKCVDIKILFTSVGRRVELVQVFKDAAIRLNARVEIWGADITNTAPALKYCDKAVIVPRISDADYIPTLIEICKKEQIKGLFPTIDTDLILLAEHKDEFKNIGTTVFVSRLEKIVLCRNKKLTGKYFQSIGLNAPIVAEKIEEYNQGFPAFIKPLDGSSSIGANRADNMVELEMYASQLGGYIVQPYIDGTEYTVDIFCDTEGTPIYVTPRIRLAVRAGEVLKTEIHHQKEIIFEILHLIEDFRPCGPITVQLIRNNQTGENCYIEINPRFGGGAPLSMKAGADAAEATLRLLMGEKLQYHPMAAEDGAVYSRFDQSIRVR